MLITTPLNFSFLTLEPLRFMVREALRIHYFPKVIDRPIESSIPIPMFATFDLLCNIINVQRYRPRPRLYKSPGPWP